MPPATESPTAAGIAAARGRSRSIAVGVGMLFWLPAVVVTSLLFYYLEMRPGTDSIAKEHGLIEVIQLVEIAAAFVLFLLAHREPESAEQVVGGAMAILVAAAFVRELDVRTLGDAPWYRWLAAQTLQEILLVVMSLPALVYILKRRKHIPAIIRLAFSWNAWPMWLAGIGVAGGIAFDSRFVRWYGAGWRFWEELIEYNGYALLVIAAWRHLELTREATRRGSGAADRPPPGA